jgi:hypothetical protein
MGFTWGVCSSRLTLKRQKVRREEGRPRVSNLGQIIREIQRDAAALPTAALREEIEINLDVQDAAIRQFYAIGSSAGNIDDLIVATSTVMISVLTTALYVRELTTRPRPAAWAFTSSIN